ncbi:MAG: DNA mismatch repair protein MutS [Deltaproteobacteria bacterium]|nr:MAG: DNA mismatch repair protein MutS [Deltaproteobacteria bacterium]
MDTPATDAADAGPAGVPASVGAVTPMMRQFLAAKAEHPDALLLFRMGDFYETFYDDAVEASRILELTLTSRNKKDDDPIPMAGVPHHALAAYLPRLVDAGKKVAICEQLEDPKIAKGIVKRAVVRVITPGVVLDENILDRRTHNYLVAIARAPRGGAVGLCWVDVSTGDRRGARLPDLAQALDELGRIEPREVLVADADDALDHAVRYAVQGVTVSRVPAPDPKAPPLDAAAAMAADYIGDTQKGSALLLRDLEVVELARTMRVGPATVRNLELVRTLADGRRKGSLLGLLDHTRTAMGSRRLKQWILYPLCDLEAIRARHDIVGALVDDPMTRGLLRDGLDGVYDLERLVGRVSAGTAGPRDLIALAESLERLPELAATLTANGHPALAALAARLDPVAAASAEIRHTLVDEPPATLKDGGVIREGYDPALDELIQIARDGKTWFADYAQRLRESSGIGSLKIKFNSVFGYFIEVTRANLGAVPDTWLRKQTLANAERYYTPELKEREEKILGADDRRLTLEQGFFDALRDRVATFGARIQAVADEVGAVDVLATLAEVAQRRGYVRPDMVEAPVVDLRGGRHPVIEALLPVGEFVPNDVSLDGDGARMVIITGPNMAGKSTVMRQVALIALLAQMGGFVPADRATIGLVDRIFTRVGASDDLARGQSTFMVEMNETARILAEATRQSLVVLDEIGRGTSTFDGVSIAWSVAEHLHDTIGARTLFATHYHELTELALTREGVANMSIAVKEWKEEIVFLRRLVPGGTNRSYGIQVARLAGLPRPVIQRAREILSNLEANALDPDSRPKLARGQGGPGAKRGDHWQLDLFAPPAAPSALLEALAAVDPEELSPRAALDLVYALKGLAEREGSR